MEAAAIGILLLVVVVTVLILQNNKGNNVPEEKKEEIKVELDSTPSSIHFSDDFLSKESVTTVEKEHTITTIYIGKEDTFIWKCPNCEAENLSSRKKCCVCNAMK